MTGLEARGREAGERAARAAAERLAVRAREALPGVEVTTEDDQVVIAGRGLGRRLLHEPALRWLGGLLR